MRHISTKKHFSNVKLNSLSYSQEPSQSLLNPLKPSQFVKKNLISSNISYTSVKCEYCKKTFKYSKNLRRHEINYCKKISSRIKNNYIKSHNKNGNSKNKLELVEYNNRCPRKIINYNTQNNNIINNNLTVNPVGEESIEHIGKERIFEILGSGDDMLKEFCKELYGINKNLNVYIDIRYMLITYVTKENKLDIESMSRMIQKLVFTHMDRIKSLQKKYKNELPEKTQRLFIETMSIYKCVINKDNIEDEEEIEKQHDLLNERFKDDVKTSILLIKDKCKKVIERIKQELELELEL